MPAPTIRFSAAAAFNQLRFVWPGLVRRKIVAEQLAQALAQVDEQLIERFRAQHPRARHATIYRVGRHEVQLRDLHSGDLSAHWVDHPRLVGAGIAFGIFAMDIELARDAARAAWRADRGLGRAAIESRGASESGDARVERAHHGFELAVDHLREGPLAAPEQTPIA